MQVRHCAAAIAVLLCSSVSMLAPTAAEAANAPTGRILFTRNLTATYDNDLNIVGTALYTINQDGTKLSQLTSLQEGNFNYPGAESYYGAWLSKNFASNGNRILAFLGQGSVQGSTLSGGYYTFNNQGQQAIKLFSPGNDEAAPGEGFLTWGPASVNLIAYGNAAGINPLPAGDQPCVYLMNPDGSNPHLLWCSKDYGQPQLVRDIHWSGDGKSLLVDVGYNVQQGGQGGYDDLYDVNVATGTGTLLANQVLSSYSGASASISYDGSVAVYQQYSPDCNNADAGGDPNYSLCAQNIGTGQTTVVQANSAVYGQLLLSPDGTEVAVAQGTVATPPETDIYLINTATGAVRQITKPSANPPSGSRAIWSGVAWSSDGSELLANREYYSSSKVVIPTTDIYVINVSAATAAHVTSGTAYDWYQPSW